MVTRGQKKKKKKKTFVRRPRVILRPRQLSMAISQTEGCILRRSHL